MSVEDGYVKASLFRDAFVAATRSGVAARQAVDYAVSVADLSRKVAEGHFAFSVMAPNGNVVEFEVEGYLVEFTHFVDFAFFVSTDGVILKMKG